MRPPSFVQQVLPRLCFAHDRMPVLLQPSDFDGWVAGNAGSELLKPAARHGRCRGG
jgi:putative SOS response-associated peptidase YedK